MNIGIFACVMVWRQRRLFDPDIYSRHVYFLAKIVSPVIQGGGEERRRARPRSREFQRNSSVASPTKSRKYKRFSGLTQVLLPGLLYPGGVIVMEVFQLRTNLIFQAGADGARWIFYRHRRPWNFLPPRKIHRWFRSGWSDNAQYRSGAVERFEIFSLL